MTYQVNTKWVDGMAFDSQVGDHTVRVDASGELGNNTGPSPKKLLLTSLAGCTGIDVVSLLNKMRVSFEGLDIDIQADLTEEHPKVFSEIRMIYKVYGKNIQKEKVAKAVEMSKTKYCGVSAMLEKNSPIKYSIEYPDEA